MFVDQISLLARHSGNPPYWSASSMSQRADFWSLRLHVHIGESLAKILLAGAHYCHQATHSNLFGPPATQASSDETSRPVATCSGPKYAIWLDPTYRGSASYFSCREPLGYHRDGLPYLLRWNESYPTKCSSGGSQIFHRKCCAATWCTYRHDNRLRDHIHDGSSWARLDVKWNESSKEHCLPPAEEQTDRAPKQDNWRYAVGVRGRST